MTRSLALFILMLAGCSATDTGRVQIFLEAEDSVPDGLVPGAGPENVVDGWTVRYQKFLVTFGSFRASRSSGGERLSLPGTTVVDMQALPEGGYVWGTFEDAAAQRWDRVGFDLPNATPAIEAPSFTSQADRQRMIDGGYSLYIEATLTKADGQSCKPSAPSDCTPAPAIKLAWGVAAGTAFDDCAPVMGDAGFSVPTGGTVQVKPTIHGDHWFFSNITQGAELTERRAQWMADCDLDRDGTTTLAELEQVRASDVFRAPDYNITGALGPVSTAYDYFVAQARTLGDYQGDGECPTRRAL